MFSLSKPKRPTATVAPPIIPAPAPAPTRSTQVRILWSQFEAWHAAQLGKIEGEIEARLRELDQKHAQLRSNQNQKKPRKGKKDTQPPNPSPKELKELEEEKTKIRLDIEQKLSGNVVRQEWDKRLSEAALESDDWIDITEDEQRKVEMILGADLEEEQQQESSSLPPKFYMVDPNSFHTLDDAWLEVKPTADEDTSSSEAWTPSSYAYASWSSEAASRSSAQSSQTSSPEWHSTKHLASDSTSSSSSSSRPARPSAHYIGPQLTSDSSDSDLESSFEKYKLTIRIQKIREFHSEAAEADIQLTIDLDESRRAKLWSKEGEAARVRVHEAFMLELRERKEAERKKEVDLERRRRRAELALAQQLKDPEPKPVATSRPSASDTPTIRHSKSAFVRTHLSSHDWAAVESGNDTPTPTGKSSAWTFKEPSSSSLSSGLLGAFAEAPPLKRFATAPAPPTLGGSSSSVWEEVTKKHAQEPSKPSVTVAAPALGPSAPSAASSNKKSKKDKEKAKADVGAGKIIPTRESNDEMNASVISLSSSAGMGMGMPGQWGWGEEQYQYNPHLYTTPSSSLSSSTTSFVETSGSGSTGRTPASSSSSIPSMSALTSSIPATTHLQSPPQLVPQLQLPDNRRVWLPPSALEANLNQSKATPPTSLSVPAVQKSVSALGMGMGTSSQTLDVPVPIQKSLSGPPELGGGKSSSRPAPAPAGAKSIHTPAAAASSSTAKSSSVSTPAVPSSSAPPTSKKKPSSASLTSTTTSSSSKGKKLQQQSAPPSQKPVPKVTIEEAPNSDSDFDSDSDSGSDSESESESDDPELTSLTITQNGTGKDKDTDKGKGKAKGKVIERLPVDSRYIIEDAAPAHPPVSVPPPKAATVVEPKGKAKAKGKAVPNSTTTTATTGAGSKAKPEPLPASTSSGSGTTSKPNPAPKSNATPKQKSKSSTTTTVIEPKPVVPQEQLRDIPGYEYQSANDSGSVGEASSPSLSASTSNQQYDVWTPSASSTVPSSYPSSYPTPSSSSTTNARWIPPSGNSNPGTGVFGNGLGGETAAAKAEKEKQKRVRWTSHSSAYPYEEPAPIGNAGPEDVFLSALDSLEAIVRGGAAVGGSASSEASGLEGVGGAGKRSRIEPPSTSINTNTNKKRPGGAPIANTDESYWQHALTSLGRGGGNVSASAM